MLLRHYYESGVGYYSKFTGAKITHGLIDTIQDRYIALGGHMKDLSLVDPEFNELEQD
tara:strand:- start:149 stop:322 length:174 start_codon:yes stop_codon:yes gene_type:complete